MVKGSSGVLGYRSKKQIMHGRKDNTLENEKINIGFHFSVKLNNHEKD